MNSLFLNISISFLKFLDIEQKNSILHQYVQFLFNNLELDDPKGHLTTSIYTQLPYKLNMTPSI